jgi:hypothetical protein
VFDNIGIKCKFCSSSATRNVQVLKYPKILIFNLNRFVQKENDIFYDEIPNNYKGKIFYKTNEKEIPYQLWGMNFRKETIFGKDLNKIEMKNNSKPLFLIFKNDRKFFLFITVLSKMKYSSRKILSRSRQLCFNFEKKWCCILFVQH